MSTSDFFRARLDGMVDPRHPLVVLAGKLPWAQIEQVLTPYFQRKARTPGTALVRDMLGVHELEFGGGVGAGGRPRLPIRLMASLPYQKNSFNLSDEELVARWSENVVWQFFSGMEYYGPRLPCNATATVINAWRVGGCLDVVARLMGYRIQLDSIQHQIRTSVSTTITVSASLRNVALGATSQSAQTGCHAPTCGVGSDPDWRGWKFTDAPLASNCFRADPCPRQDSC